MVVEEKFVWLSILFAEDAYSSEMLKPVIVELIQNRYKISNPVISPVEPLKNYLTRINDRTYLKSRLGNIIIVGEEPTVRHVHTIINKHFNPKEFDVLYQSL